MRVHILVFLLGACTAEPQPKQPTFHERAMAHARGCKKMCDAAGAPVARMSHGQYEVPVCECGIGVTRIQQAGGSGFATGVAIGVGAEVGRAAVKVATK